MNDDSFGMPRALRVLLLALCIAAPGVGAAPKDESDDGERAYRSGDLIGAMAKYRKAADAGYAPAQARLADFLDAADEDAAAVALYRKAAAQGDAHGEFGLGSMYAKGEGVAKDVDEGRRLIFAAADKNYPAAVELAIKVHRSGGLGLPPDPAQAGLWEARARALGIVVPQPPEPKAKKK
jgi:TPR repeat protein